MANATSFGTAFRQNLLIVVMLIGPVVALGLVLRPLDSLFKLVGVCALLLISAATAIALINRKAKAVKCTSCSTELYAFHELHQHMKHCPNCGSPIANALQTD
ncbi:hypothetical protein HPT27_05475 [Permianibacter sp. IMCC34836]|uniref:hypothetical protein n=1 Tax=Permianibacter fluminis TaxID=2738515 RepID=UPI001556E865|nr:hypothetical protein [Permianibacter fluminis]NQD36469.1 hypothetical protein [Permianibacter fluminis]